MKMVTSSDYYYNPSGALCSLGRPIGAVPSQRSLVSLAVCISNTSMAATSAGGRTGPIRIDLLEQLHHDSEALQDLSLAARNRLRNIRVVSFYETEPSPPLSSLVSHFTFSMLGHRGISYNSIELSDCHIFIFVPFTLSLPRVA